MGKAQSTKSEQNRKYFNDNTKNQKYANNRPYQEWYGMEWTGRAPTISTTRQEYQKYQKYPQQPSKTTIPRVVALTDTRFHYVLVGNYLHKNICRGSKQNSLAINYENTLNRWVRVQMSPPEAECKQKDIQTKAVQKSTQQREVWAEKQRQRLTQSRWIIDRCMRLFSLSLVGKGKEAHQGLLLVRTDGTYIDTLMLHTYSEYA